MSIDPAHRPTYGRALVPRPPWSAPDAAAHRGGDAPRDDRRSQGRSQTPARSEVSPYLQRRLRSLEEVLQWRQQRSGDGGEDEE